MAAVTGTETKSRARGGGNSAGKLFRDAEYLVDGPFDVNVALDECFAELAEIGPNKVTKRGQLGDCHGYGRRGRKIDAASVPQLKTQWNRAAGAQPTESVF